MKLIYKYSITILIAFSLMICATNSIFAQNSITVLLDGKQLNFDVPPRIENGTTLVPMRKIFESLDATLSYDSRTNTVHAIKAETEITLPIGSNYPLINGKKVKIDVPGKLVNGRTLVPLRFISEALGANVHWDGQQEQITIQSSKSSGFNVIKIY